MNKETFEQLQTRLHKHHILHEDNLCTAAPIYLVQVKKVDWGYEEEYAKIHQLYNSCSESSFDSVEEFVDDYDDEEWEYLFENTDYADKEDFLECHKDLDDVCNTLEQLDPHGGWSYLHGNHRWETHNIFLTMDDANAYIDGKHIRGDHCRIYVDSLCRSYEFRGLLESISKGELIWKGFIMTPEQISLQIEELCSCHVHAWVSSCPNSSTTIQLDGDFTPKDLLGIVELLKKEDLL